MQALNYTAQAIEDLGGFGQSVAAVGMAHDSEIVSVLARQLSRSTVFALPEEGRLFDDRLRGLSDLPLRLPFPAVALEYRVSQPSEAVQNGQLLHAPRRVILATELHADGRGMAWLPSDLRVELTQLLADQEGVGVLVFSAHSDLVPGVDRQSPFAPDPTAWLLPSRYPTLEETQAKLDKWTKTPMDPELARVGINNSPHSSLVPGRPLYALKDLLTLSHKNNRHYTREQMIASLNQDIAQEALVVLEFIEACSCANVEHQVIQAAPKDGVAARRARDGKLPLLETRSLSLTLPGHRAQGSAFDSLRGGRASPRQHLRRGHIRRLEDGRRIWVQSAVVGATDSGRIDKHYAVRPRVA